MNERWTRGVRHALLFLLVPALGACAVGRLSDRIVIDATTQVTDKDGKGDLLLLSDLVRETEVKLQPGDVLTYTRWSPGFALAESARSAQTHEPATDRFSLALRLISPDGRLSSEEIRFLGTVLTTHRQKWNSESRIIELQSILERNQIEIWNALVKNISLVRLQSFYPGSSNETSTTLVAAICMKALGNDLEENSAQLFAEMFSDTSGKDCSTTSERATELTNPPFIPVSPLYAAASVKPGEQETHHYFLTGNLSYVQFNFTQVERNGVRVDRKDGPEAQWTLREWEKSGICKIRDSDVVPVIRRIRLAGGRRKIWIHRDEGDYLKTYHLQIRLTNKTSSRWIERISKEDTFAERAVLDQSALDVLRMSDLDFVEWGLPRVREGHRREAVDVHPNGCRFLDAD